MNVASRNSIPLERDNHEASVRDERRHRYKNKVEYDVRIFAAHEVKSGGQKHRDGEKRRRQWCQPRQNPCHCRENHAYPAEKFAEGDEGQQSSRYGGDPLPSLL